MDIQIKYKEIDKKAEAFGIVYVVLFKIDGINTVRVFTTMDKAQAFCKSIKGYKTMFIETLDREERQLK